MMKIGFGGSCHWCTEAVFQSLRGVAEVRQGWIASEGLAAEFSEAVFVVFDAGVISLETLVAVHFHSHSCTAEHRMRAKYRSAVYTFSREQVFPVRQAIERLQADFDAPVITQIIPFKAFKLNEEEYLNYYYSDPEKPFCQNVVRPKLDLLRERFGALVI
jgi:peptide-methionine (S)-S-oxide reductase